jgi:hypothetical protein
MVPQIGSIPTPWAKQSGHLTAIIDMELTGTLKEIHPIIERTTDKGVFKSRNIWITTTDNPDYPQTIELQVNQGKVDLFSGVSIGAPVTCSINVRGKEWSKDGKVYVFNSLVCWKVVSSGQVSTSTPAPGKGFGPEHDIPVEPLDTLPF